MKKGIKIEAIVEIKLAQLTENDHNFFLKKRILMKSSMPISLQVNLIMYCVATKDLNSFSHFVINTLNKIKGVVSINSKIILQIIQK